MPQPRIPAGISVTQTLPAAPGPLPAPLRGLTGPYLAFLGELSSQMAPDLRMLPSPVAAGWAPHGPGAAPDTATALRELLREPSPCPGPRCPALTAEPRKNNARKVYCRQTHGAPAAPSRGSSPAGSHPPQGAGTGPAPGGRSGAAPARSPGYRDCPYPFPGAPPARAERCWPVPSPRGSGGPGPAGSGERGRQEPQGRRPERRASAESGRAPPTALGAAALGAGRDVPTAPGGGRRDAPSHQAPAAPWIPTDTPRCAGRVRESRRAGRERRGEATRPEAGGTWWGSRWRSPAHASHLPPAPPPCGGWCGPL